MPRPRDQSSSARRCASCGQPKPLLALLQLAPLELRGGRRTYVCIARTCLQEAQAPRLARALRGPVAPLDLAAHVHALATMRLLGLLSLARRSNRLICGAEQVQATVQREPTAFFLLACDVSPRQRRHLPQAGIFLSCARLGQATGLGRLGVLAIRPGGLAKQAAYWQQVWYETLPKSPDQEDASPASSSKTMMDSADLGRMEVVG